MLVLVEPEKISRFCLSSQQFIFRCCDGDGGGGGASIHFNEEELLSEIHCLRRRRYNSATRMTEKRLICS